MDLGPTELRPGSHYLSRDLTRLTLLAKVCGVKCLFGFSVSELSSFFTINPKNKKQNF
jgi:hypothetical protein